MSSSELTLKLYLPLPIAVGYMTVPGGMPNSVCGLSFCHSHGWPVSIFNLKLDVVKTSVAMTHLQSIPAAAN